MKRKLRILTALLTAISLLCSCSNNSRVSVDGSGPGTSEEITESSEYTEEMSDSITSIDDHFKANLNKDLIYINDVSAVNDSIYISGRKEKTSGNSIVIGNEKYEIENRSYSSAEFVNDVLYLMYLNDDNIPEIMSIDMNGDNEKIQLEGFSEDFCAGESGNIYFYSTLKNAVCSGSIEGTIDSSVNTIDPVNSLVKITCDEDENIYLFYENKIKGICLEKYDAQLNLIYSCNNFSDMQGNISEIKYIGDNKLEISTTDHEADEKYVNIVSAENGVTVDRFNKDLYDVIIQTESWISSEGEMVYIEQSSDRSAYFTEIYDLNGSKKDEIELITEKGGFVSKIHTNQDGTIYYLENTLLISENAEYEYIIHTIDPDKQHSSFSFLTASPDYSPAFITADMEGNIFVGGNDGNYSLISIFSKTGELVSEQTYSDIQKFSSVSLCDDNLYICYHKYNENIEISYLSADDPDLNSTAFDIMDVQSLVKTGFTDKLLIRDLNGLSLYDINLDTKNEILNFAGSGINEYEWNFAYFSNEKSIKYNEDQCFIIKNNTKSLSELNVAVTYLPEKIEDHILKFNASNNDYRINVHQYSYGEDSYNSMNLDLISGKIDVIISDSSFNVEEYDKGIFTDLNEFIKQDPEINDDNYFSNIIDLYSSEGKVYEIVPEFLLYVIYVCDDDLSKGISWTQNEFMNYISEENSLSKAPAYKLPDIVRCLSGGYIDYEKGSCSFTDKNFLKVLELTGKNLSYDEIVPVDQVKKEMIGRDYRLLTEEFNNSLWMPESEECDIKIKGFPDDNKSGIVVSPYFGLSILSNSEHKKEAWDFIRYYLSEEYQKSIIRETFNIPLNRNVWQNHIKTLKASEYMKEISETVISSANYRDYAVNNKVYQILEQAYTDYCSGNISAEDAVREMQSKTELYLNERN